MALVAWASIVGCQNTSTFQCGDLVCPSTTRCVVELGLCIPADQADVCESESDGTACEFSGVTNGVCVSEVCLSSGCGDGRVDAGEVCDDGNRQSGDGCRADCRSDEACGNGLLDPTAGELCDDGNEARGDGCSRTCGFEVCGNGTRDPGESCDDGNTESEDGCSADCLSSELCGNGVVDSLVGEECDPDSDSDLDCGPTCLVVACGNGYLDEGEACDDANIESGDGCSAACVLELCGNGVRDVGEECDDGNFRSQDGCSSGCFNEQWVWSRRDEYVSRTKSAVTWDSSRDRAVLFGGYSGSPVVYDTATWEYVDGRWTSRRFLVEPPARASPALAFHPGLGVTVMFGGIRSLELFDDTWHYDGVAWTLQSPSESPPTFSRAGMVYDAGRDVMVLVGSGSGPEQTWEYDGVTWAQVATPNPLETYLDPIKLIYDPVRARVISLYSRWDNIEVYEYDGADWTEIALVAPPNPLRDRPAYFFDADLGKTVIVGGDRSGSALGDAFTYDGSTFTALTPATTGPVMSRGVGAHDPKAGVSYVFGMNAWPDTGTWSLNDGDWERLTGSSTPGVNGLRFYDSIRHAPQEMGGDWDLWRQAEDGWWPVNDPEGTKPPFSSSCYGHDIASDRIVMLGGVEFPGVYDETWFLEEAGWRKLDDAAPAPLGRHGCALSRVGETDEFLLFGGMRGAFSPRDYLSDTWSLSGDVWTELSPTDSPSDRHALAVYDSARDVHVLFGGYDGSSFLGDTWEFDGDNWNEIDTELSPSVTGYSRLVYDPVRERTILIGPTPPGGTGIPVWEYNNENWSALDPLGGPPSFGDVYYSIDERAIVMSTAVDWLLQLSSLTPLEVCDDEEDNDDDSLSDCEDPDCDLTLACEEAAQ